jgi:tetratricopeptide (TPR) repeat protein
MAARGTTLRREGAEQRRMRLRSQLEQLLASRPASREEARATLGRSSSGAADLAQGMALQAALESRIKDAVGAADLADWLRGDGSGIACRLELVALLAERGQFQDAGAVCEHLISAAPRDATPIALLGVIRLHEGRHDDAQALLELAVARGVETPDVLVHLGAARLLRGERRRGAAAMKRALDLDPQHSLALEFARMTAGMDGEDDPQAASPIPEAMAQFAHAERLFHTGDYDAAITAYKVAIELDPKFSRAYLFLGDCYFRQGQLRRAEAWYRKATQVNPKDARAHRFLGDLLLREGRLTRAIECLQKACALDPHYAPARESLDLALRRRSAVH